MARSNFHIEVDTDSRDNLVKIGTRNKDDSIFVRFFIGGKEALRVIGTTTDPEGKLTYNVVFIRKPKMDEGSDTLSIRTER